MTCTASVLNLKGVVIRLMNLRKNDNWPLCACTLAERRLVAHSVAQEACVSDHDSIINAEPLPSDINTVTTLFETYRSSVV